MMTTYDALQPYERRAIENALDVLQDGILHNLANDDRAAKAAEALATYVMESRK